MKGQFQSRLKLEGVVGKAGQDSTRVVAPEKEEEEE